MREATGARDRRCGCKVVNECLSHDQEVVDSVQYVHDAFHSFTPFPDRITFYRHFQFHLAVLHTIHIPR